MMYLVVFCLLYATHKAICLPKYSPGDIAPSFEIQTLDGRLVYKEKSSKDKSPSNPIMVCAFTNRSAFLQALWTEEGSVRHLLERSPKNTEYVFLSLSDNARNDVKGMRQNLFGEMERLYKEKRKNHMNATKDRSEAGTLQSTALFKREGISKNLSTSQAEHREKRNLKAENYSKVLKKKHLVKKSHHLKLLNSQHTGESDLVSWKKHFHFASYPLFTFGNWIPFVMARWPCLGTACGLPQVVFKNSKGDIINVAARLDARYDWQPTPFTSGTKRTKHKLRYISNPCHIVGNETKPNKTDVALVSSDNQCSIFRKIQNVAKANISRVVVYARENEGLKEIKCHEQECYHLLAASASMISFEAGEQARKMLLKEQDVYVDFQTTSQDNFFFAIDHRGRLAETGLFLYPSLHFLAYEAQWFHYEADLMKDTGGHAKVIHVFNHTVMQGPKGAIKKIHIPDDYLTYRNVELDMSLECPEAFDSSCPHWDHVVHLTVCCEEDHELCGAEIGRWITPYARSIGRWLTPITPLLPLFTSSTCTLTMKTVPWEMPWTPTLNIRFSDHILDSTDGYSKKRYSPEFVPFKVLKLFSGGTFDKNYNNKYKPISFYPPKWTEKVEVVAIITGHGKDNNGCAEFCVTSHHFVLNNKTANVKVFKNAATAMGCAGRVDQGVEPNEHGTWLYGRDGWCPGQEVVPWVIDVTKQIRLNKNNSVEYFSYYDNHNPNPKHSPGYMDMSSYLVFYKTDL